MQASSDHWLEQSSFRAQRSGLNVELIAHVAEQADVPHEW